MAQTDTTPILLPMPGNRDTLIRRQRLRQWTFWECDESTLEAMRAEVEQEMGKLALVLQRVEKEFNQLVAAGDPITIEEKRQQARLIGQKWDTMRVRQREIEAVLRQKRLDQRMSELGQRFGIPNLLRLLRYIRVLLITASLVAVIITLLPDTDPISAARWDTVNLFCSLLLTSEFAVRLVLVSGRRQYLMTRGLDIFLALPLVQLTASFADLANVGRLVTLLRIGRLVRLLRGERRNTVPGGGFWRAPEFVLFQRIALGALILVATGAAFLQILEGEKGQPFASFSDNLWWGIKIVLTGNVDSSPATALGRVVTIGIIVVGISLTSILIATVTALLVNIGSETNGIEEQHEDLSEQMNVVRDQLGLLTNARQDAAQTAARISHMVVHAQEEHGDLLAAVVNALVQEFGCQQASIHLINEATRDIECFISAGNAAFKPEDRVSFDEGLIGRAASSARRGNSDVLPEFESDPLPLADGGAIGIPLFVRMLGRGQGRNYPLGVLHIVVPQEWLRDEMIRMMLVDVSESLAQYLYIHEIVTNQEELLESISDLQITMEKVTTTLEYEKLLFVIAEGASALLDADMSKVMLMQGKDLYGAAWAGMDDDLGRALYSRLGEGLSGICAKTGNPVKSSNLLTDNRVTVTSSQALRSEMRSELCVPIRARGVVLGVLSVMSKVHKRFNQEEEYLLSTLAGQAGAAIENARIYTIEQRRLRLAETMQDINLHLTGTIDEEQTLRWILKQIRRAIKHDSASILLVEDQTLRLIASFGPKPPHPAVLPLKDHALFAEVAAIRAPVLIAETSTHPAWPSGQSGSWIGAPLIVEDQVIGLLGIGCQEPNALSTADAEISTRFAVQAALAVRITRLYRALRACEERSSE